MTVMYIHEALAARLALAALGMGLCLLGPSSELLAAEEPRRRARDLGLVVGVLPPGPLNAITDVAGVSVGHATRVEGDSIRTGVTVILPHDGNLFAQKVPGAVFVGNGFGKLAGSTQVQELGEIETPIVLTSTLSVPRAADALLEYTMAQPENSNVRSINPLVGETNDGQLNDIRSRPIRSEDVLQAIRAARGGSVAEGSVGAGTGTIAFGFKGGIGTASRRLPEALGGFTVGVLVQSNFGGVLTIGGAPVGQKLGRYFLRETLASKAPDMNAIDSAAGSIMIVIATDAPLESRNLERLAFRSMFGLARTGASGAGESGDYAIAFSTAPDLRIRADNRLHPQPRAVFPTRPEPRAVLPNDALSPLFLAVIEATEEAIYNSLLRATTTTSRGRTVEALPLKETIEILKTHKLLGRPPAPAKAP